MAGLSSTGLTIKRLPEIITDLKSEAEQIFSDLLPSGDIVDTSDNSTIGRLIGVVAPSQADLWEAAQQVYDSFNPNAAVGISLDNMISLSGISRYGAEPTKATCLFEGDTGTLIGLSSKVSASISRRIFSLLSTVSLNQYSASGIGISIATVSDATDYSVGYSSDGVAYTTVTITSAASSTEASILAQIKAEVDSTTGGTFTTYYQDGLLFISRSDPFQSVTFSLTANITADKSQKLGIVYCDTDGALEQLSGTIDTIAVPVLGWDSVYNPLDAAEGRLEETDEELRERFRNSKYFQAANILESLIDALNNVTDVIDVVVYENDTDTTDAIGVLPHSFMPIVLGGLPTSIAEAIWQNKPTGIRSQGDTTVSVSDSQGIPHSISFARPTNVPIYVSINITDTGEMPGDVVAQLKEALLTYGESNFSIGDDVVYSRLYTPINSIAGFQVNSLYAGTTASPVTMTNITIAFDSVAQWDSSYITVTVV